jgi:hypothetical protein
LFSKVKHRFGGDQVQVLHPAALVTLHLETARLASLLDVRLHREHEFVFRLCFLFVGFRLLAGALGLARDRLHVGEQQLGVDGFDIAERVDAVGDVGDVIVLEAAHYLGDGVGFADVPEKLVAEPFPFRRPGDQPGDVDKFHRRRDDLLRLDDIRDLVKARIRHLDHAYIGVDGAERVVFRGDTRFRQRIEQRRFADVGQADDATFESHNNILRYAGPASPCRCAPLIAAALPRACRDWRLRLPPGPPPTAGATRS